MSHFYGNLHGSRGEVTRQGSKESGIRCHVRGWDMGVEVEVLVNSEGEDEARIHVTGGSSGSKPDKLIGWVDAEGTFYMYRGKEE